MTAAPPAGAFPTTRWTAILAAQGDAARRQEALREILVAYWRPLLVYARCRGLDADAARDAVQGFSVHLLEGDLVARLDPARGRLRDYLKASLRHYLANVHAGERAERRGGSVLVLPLDVELADRVLAGGPSHPEAAFDRGWAIEVMERALRRLRAEYGSGARRGPFAAIESFFAGGDPPSYADAARRHGMSIPRMKSLLFRARQRYRELVLEEVRGTVEKEGDGEAEVTHLLAALGP